MGDLEIVFLINQRDYEDKLGIAVFILTLFILTSPRAAYLHKSKSCNEKTRDVPILNCFLLGSVTECIAK